MADDNVIRLDFESNLTKAQAQAERFISSLEKRFKALGKQLENALEGGIVDSSNSKEVEKLRKELNRLEGELKDLKKAGDNAGQGISKIGIAFSALAGVIAGLGLAKIASGFANLAQDAFQATSALEQTTNALESLVARELVQTGQFDNLNDALGASSEKAAELLDFIRELARQSPFSREQIQSAFQTALAYGFTIEEAQRLTQATVDLAAASGKGAEATGRIALALGQIQAKGKVSAEELNQLRESGLNVNPVLEGLGFTLDDVTKGLVDADIFINAVIESLERDFGGAAARATNSLAGLVSTLGDLRTDALIAFFEPALKELQPLIAEFAGNFEDIQPSIREAGQAFSELVSVIIKNAPEAANVLDGLSKSFERLGVFIQRTSNVSKSLSGQFATELNEQLIEEFDKTNATAEEKAQELLSILADLSFADQLRGLEVPIEEQLNQVVLEIIAGSNNVEEATQRLEAVFGDLLQIGGRGVSLGSAEIGFVPLGNSIDDLIEKSNRLTDTQRALAESQEFTNIFIEREIAVRAQQQQSIQAVNRELEERRQIAEQTKAANEAEAQATELAAKANRDLVVSLVESTKSADKNAIAIFKQAEAAGATDKQLEALAIQLGLLNGQQIAAQRALERLTIEFINGDVSAEDFARTAAELNAIIAGTADNASQAAVSVNTLSSAFKDALTPKRGGGGGRADTSQADALRAEAKAIEEQADAVQSAVQQFGEIVKLDDDALSELIENSRDFGDELFNLTQQAGASIDTLIELGVATGEFTEEQAKAALEVIRRERGLKAIAGALADQTISTEEAAAAAAELNRQIAEGETVDLTTFGIDVTDVDTEAVPALLRETAQASREAAEALTKIAGALGGAADSSDDLATSIKRQVAEQRLANATNLEGRIQAIRLAEAMGLYDEATARALEQTALLDEQVRLLNVASAEGALSDGQLVEALELVTEKGYSARDAFIEVGGSLDDLPKDVQIELETNQEEILGQIDEIEDRLNRLERERVVRLRVEREEITVETGGTGAGSLPTPEGGGTGEGKFARGGYTGGNRNEVRGIVHGQELVVPPEVIKGGVPAIANFAANNVPNFRNSVSLANPSPVQNAAVPSVTTINNTTTAGDTITTTNSNRGGDTIILNGEQAGRVARSIFNTQDNVRQNNLMKRNGKLNALWAS